jgi:hypothetical protein
MWDICEGDNSMKKGSMAATPNAVVAAASTKESKLSPVSHLTN